MEELDVITTQLRQRLTTTDGGHDSSTASSAPLISTTYNLQPYSVPTTLEMGVDGGLQGTTSTVASIPTTTSHSGPPHSSSMSATTTFLGISNLSDLPQDSPRTQHNNQSQTPQDSDLAGYSDLTPNSPHSAYRSSQTPRDSDPAGYSDLTPNSPYSVNQPSQNPRDSDLGKLVEGGQFESLGFKLTSTLSSGSAGLGNTQNLLSTLDSTYTMEDQPEFSDREHLVHFEDDLRPQERQSLVPSQRSNSESPARDLTLVTQMTLSPASSPLRIPDHDNNSVEHSWSEAYNAEDGEAKYLFDQYQGGSDEDFGDDAQLVMPRPLNDVSNINFNNTMRNPLAELQDGDQMTKYSEDSWFSNVPGHGDSRIMETESIIDEDQQIEDIIAQQADSEGVDDNIPQVDTGADPAWQGLSKVDTGADPAWQGLSKMDTGADPAWQGISTTGRPERSTNKDTGREEESAGFNYSKDSWESDEAEEDDQDGDISDNDEGKGGPFKSSPAHKDSSAEEVMEQLELSTEEKHLLNNEDPTTFSLVSRTSLGDTKRSASARKATMYRREYERHRHGRDSSSDEEKHHSSSDTDALTGSNHSYSYRKNRKRTKRKQSKTKRDKSETHDSDNDVNDFQPVQINVDDDKVDEGETAVKEIVNNTQEFDKLDLGELGEYNDPVLDENHKGHESVPSSSRSKGSEGQGQSSILSSSRMRADQGQGQDSGPPSSRSVKSGASSSQSTRRSAGPNKYPLLPTVKL